MLPKVKLGSDGSKGPDSFFSLLNALFDVFMPQLKDTEFRVLCVVFRQTWGRKDLQTGRRKERDWLSQSQLKKRTGRGGDAVATAVDALVCKGLLMVDAEDGMPLSTPQARRRHLSRLFYRLGPAVLAGEDGVSGKVSQPLEKTRNKPDIFGEAADVFGADASQSRVDKADTTKKKQDRNNSYKVSIEKFENRVEKIKTCEELTPVQKQSIQRIKGQIRKRLSRIISAQKCT